MKNILLSFIIILVSSSAYCAINFKRNKKQNIGCDASTIGSGTVDNAKNCIIAGVDINKTDFTGRTALVFAIRNGNTEVVEEILKSDDVEVNFQDYYGNSPLDEAMFNGHDEIVERLVHLEK